MLPAAKCGHAGLLWLPLDTAPSRARVGRRKKKVESRRTHAGSGRRPPRTIRFLPRLKNAEEIADFVFGFGRAFHSPADLGQEQLAIILAQAVDCLAHGVLREGQFGGGRFVALAVFTLTGEERMQGLEDFALAGLVVAGFQLAEDFPNEGGGPFPLELALGVVRVARRHPVAGFGEHCVDIAEASGSSPLPPTIASVLNEDLPLRELLETLLSPDIRRKLRLRHMTNDELFRQYDSDSTA